jgi:hypothetical protein
LNVDEVERILEEQEKECIISQSGLLQRRILNQDIIQSNHIF